MRQNGVYIYQKPQTFSAFVYYNSKFGLSVSCSDDVHQCSSITMLMVTVTADLSLHFKPVCYFIACY